MIAVVIAPVGEVASVRVGPTEIEAAVGKGLEVRVAVVVNHGSVDASESGIVILGDLCLRKQSLVSNLEQVK